MLSIRFILKLALDSPLAIHSNYERGFKLHSLLYTIDPLSSSYSNIIMYNSVD